MSDTHAPTAATTGAERTRRWRERRNRGVKMQASVEVTEEAVLALINAGRLDHRQDGGTNRVRREDVSEAIGRLLAEWTERR